MNLLINCIVGTNSWSQEYGLVGQRGLMPKGKCTRANCTCAFHGDSTSRLPRISSQVWLCRDRQGHKKLKANQKTIEQREGSMSNSKNKNSNQKKISRPVIC